MASEAEGDVPGKRRTARDHARQLVHEMVSVQADHRQVRLKVMIMDGVDFWRPRSSASPVCRGPSRRSSAGRAAEAIGRTSTRPSRTTWASCV
jgi:hypothetical protein